MIANLFSRFDPTTRASLSLNWLSTLLGLILVPYLYWARPRRSSLFWGTIISRLHKEFKALLGPANPGITIIFISLFRLIVFNNFLGLMPYIFTRTRHMAITLSLALPLWGSFFGWFNHTKHIFAHLVPAGTPIGLTPLMVLIETVRNVIRPGTLAIRLAANIIAGHLLLTLLGNTGPSIGKALIPVLVVSQILLLVLESAVAVIQSYVFAALRTLYAREVN